MVVFCVVDSSVARGGGRVKYSKSHVFNAFEADFLWKIENSPPHKKTAPPETFEFPNLAEKSDSISAKTFFFFRDHPFLGGKNL